jgi:hypothetical protein
MTGYNINMVHKKLDKNLFGKLISNKERLIGRDKISSSVNEPNRSKSNPRFSWDKHCQGVERIMGRLDIIYVSKASFIRRIKGLCNVW